MSHSPQINTTDNSDEFDLLEAWQVLSKRKLLILSCFIVCLAAGAAYGYLTKPLYQTSVMLRIGRIADNVVVSPAHEKKPSALLENTEELVSRVVTQYNNSAQVPPGKRSDVNITASVDRRAPAIVHLTAQSQSPEAAAERLSQVTKEVMTAHDNLLQTSLNIFKQRIEFLNQQRNESERLLAESKKLVDELKTRDPVQASLLLLERASFLGIQQTQNEEHLSLTLKISPPYAQPTTQLNDIAAATTPVQPKKSLILTLSSVAGLMIGVMLAFLAEYLSNAKNKALRTQSSSIQP